MQLDNWDQGPNCLPPYQAIKQQDVLGMINMCELLSYPMIGAAAAGPATNCSAGRCRLP